MLGRLFKTRLRAAETALRRGRLDEACRIATAPDIRGDRRGRAVLRDLSQRLIDRARERFADDRFAEALHDLRLAETAGAPPQRIGELRGQIGAVANEIARQERTRREQLAEARRRFEHGSLDAGRRILDVAGHADPEADRIKQDIEMRDHEAAETFEQVRRLVKTGQWVAAMERFAQAKKLDPHDPACAKIENELCTRVLNDVRESIKQGRMQRADDELACLGELGTALPAKRELEEMLRLARQAGDALHAGDYDAARQRAMRLQHLAPKVGWVSDAIGQLASVDETVTALRAGPLGAFEPPAGTAGPVHAGPGRGGHAAPGKAAALAETVGLPVAAGRRPPDHVLLLVDGGGSYLLLRKDRVSIGKAATSKPADIAMFSDLADRHADIARIEDDYFLFSPKGVEISGQRTGHQLLQDGDRVVLGRKAKFTFRLPSRRSPSATLDLSDTSKLPHDVRRVVLFSRNAMIGSGPGYHIQCRMAEKPLVLFERGGTLWVRPSGRGGAATEAVRLGLEQTVELAGVSMTAKPWSVRSRGGKL